MPTNAFDTIEELVSSSMAACEDPEVHYKLRTALSLLGVIEQREDLTREALGDAPLDESVRSALEDLGYLE